MKLKVIKRNGNVADFNEEKIKNAITKGFLDYGEITEEKETFIKDAIENIKLEAEKYTDGIEVEEIQDIIVARLRKAGFRKVAKGYQEYREKRAKARELLERKNTIDDAISELINGESDYWNDENANKNAKLVTTQRDYIAGITSTDYVRRYILPKEVTEAHDLGIIHFHDIDYMAENMRTNCCLVNLEDMLQNGTVINGVMIEKPHRFLTACTIATQIITAVSSSQYGGVTVSLTHLAPFVRSSRERYYQKYRDRGLTPEECERFSLEDLKKEITDGVQTFNYQVNSMSTTNGQAPFLSVAMYLGETDDYKEELAMLIEEFLKQRILGFKNRKGVYITQAFPKLLYILEEDNIEEDSRYYYLTELAAKCTAKRMVPDYISEKVMKELKKDKFGNGNCYPCINKTCA